MTLFGSLYQFSESRGFIVLAFTVKPPKALRDAIRAHCFKERDPLTWVRRSDANGLAAAHWLEKRLKELI